MANYLAACRAAFMFGEGIRFRLAGIVMAVLLLLTAFMPAYAGFERYDYDSLGRLIRVIDERGRVTEYRYDGVGNILQVIGGGTGAQAPTVTSITPATIRRGETKQVAIVGNNFTGVAVGTSAIGLDILNVKNTATQITLKLVATNSAELGPQSIVLTSAAGSAAATITVTQVAPKLYVDPVPLAVPPDNIGKQFVLRLSSPDTTDHMIGLAAGNGNIEVSPALVTIAAGQTTTYANVTGKTAGQSSINLTSATLGNISVPVYVTNEFAGIGTSYGRPLGVVVTDTASTGNLVSPILSRVLGVAVGNYVSGMSPKAFVIGTGPTTLMIAGSGLNTATSIAINPSAGVTVGVPTAAGDGRSLTVPLTVAAEAPLETRQVIVKDAAGNGFAATHPDADRIDIVRHAPEIDSLEPLHALRGSTVTLTIRGRNLQGLQAEIVPATGMSPDANPSVNADGTVATVQLGIGVDAPIGEYLVVARTAGGTSSTTKTGNNTFRIVNELLGAVTPVSSRPLGIVLQDATSGAGSIIGLQARLLGIAVGSSISAVSPNSGMIGNTVSLTLQGSELGGVSSVQFQPNTGLTVGAIVPATDGKSVGVQVTVAADAPLDVRRMKVMAGAAEIPFANPSSNQFLVTAPMPEIHSMTPIVIQVGKTSQTMTIRGRNFQGATAVTVMPADGITVSTPSVNAGGTELSVNVSVAANASPGQRIVAVVTPAGQSDGAPTAANTLTIASNISAAYSPVTSSVVGVFVNPGSVPQTLLPVVSGVLGIVLQEVSPASAQQARTSPVGVVVGSAATALEPAGFVPGESGTLLVRGTGLDRVTTVNVTPSDGIAVGTPVLAADGNSLLATVTVAADATALIPRRVSLIAGSEEIPFVGGVLPQIAVGPGVPTIESITPILATQGDTVSMLIRGTKFSGAVAVTVIPPDGVSVSNALSVNAAGTELGVNLGIAANATPGARVIQVWVPGASSTDQAVPANTFTINPR